MRKEDGGRRKEERGGGGGGGGGGWLPSGIGAAGFIRSFLIEAHFNTATDRPRPVPLRARVHQLHCHRSFCHALQTDLGAPPSRDLWRILVTSMWPYPYPILSRPVLILWLSYAPLALVSCHRCAFLSDATACIFPISPSPHLTSPPLLFPQLYLCR